MDELDAVEDRAEEARARAEQLAATIPMVDYCGFFDLAEARVGRDILRESGIHCEITIREHPGAPLNEAAVEECWLRVEHAHYRQAQALLQAQLASAATDGESAACPACGAAVSPQDAACPDCGVQLKG